MDIIDTTTKTLREILSSKYEVPKFQRNYSWKIDQWTELWDDILELSNEDNEKVEKHYLGYLVLQGDENAPVLTIVDGQQRLTTLTLIILGALYKLQDLNSSNRMNAIKKYIGEEDIVTLELENKIKLNSRNDPTFSKKLTTLKEKIEVLAKKKFAIGSNKLLCKATLYFKEAISEFAKDDPEQISKLIEQITSNIIFTVIRVGNQTNAYKLFQALNDRGVQLSVDDLLKNHLFTVIDETTPLKELDQDELEKQWFEVINTVGETNVPRFLRADWNRKYKDLITLKKLYKCIRDDIETEQQATNYLTSLKTSSVLFNAIRNPNSDYWDKKFPLVKDELRECLKCINTFNVVTPIGLIMTVIEKYGDNKDELRKIINYINVITVRYNAVCRRQANIQEVAYYKLSYLIHKDIDPNIKENMSSFYPSDEEFMDSFKILEITNNRRAKHLLGFIEKFINPNGLVNPDEASLEHIFPNTPNESWKQFADEDEIEDCTNRLGNMTIITSSMNSQIGNKSFKDKKEELSKSPLKLNEKVCSYENWTTATISDYQEWLAEKANEKWRIDW